LCNPAAGQCVNLSTIAAEDREFLDFFADQYWPLRRVGFLLTGDWHEALPLPAQRPWKVVRLP
jgi:hypothetical protein